jgi:putative membrane protein
MKQDTPLRASSFSRSNLSSSAESGNSKPSRTLIICIDRDDDIGVKTGIKTPIIGRDACISAATELSVTDPEEADANAIFAAVKEYDNLLSKGEFCEVVTVSGLFERGVMGDKKIRNQIAEILKGYPADSAVLVSDGVEGEELAPVIQSLVPIVSIRKVVVKHSRSVEETYQVLGRYLRMLVFDSRYAKYALGVPGIIFIALVLTTYFFPNADAPLILVVFIGVVFIIRGFDIDRRIESIGKLSATGYLRLFSVIASVLIVLVGIATGVAVFFPIGTAGVCSPTATPCILAKEVSKTPSLFPNFAPQMAGYFIQNSQLFVWMGFAIYITTTIFFNLIRPGSRRIARYLVELFVLGLLYFPVAIFANVLISPRNNSDFFVAIIMFALAVNFTIAAYLYRFFSRRRRETQVIEV